MNGNVLQRSWSGLSHRSWTRILLESLLLMGLGAIAIALHTKLRIPLNIPGKHGIIFMAIFVAARLSSNLRYASSITSLGIGVLLLFPMGFSDPFAGFNYMLPGIALDVFYLNLPGWRRKVLFLALIAGIGYMLIPLSRIILMTFTGAIYPGFVKHGVLTPLLFFLFGSVGGFLGTGVSRLIFKPKN